MPSPQLKGLPVSPEVRALRALQDVLQDDPTLKGVGVTWEFLDGRTTELRPPDTRSMPYIAVLVGPSSSSVYEAGAYDEKIGLLVTFATRGLHADDQLNLFNAFRSALKYENPYRGATVAEYLNDAGCIVVPVYSAPTFGPWPPPRADGSTTAQDLIGTTRLTINLRIDF